MTQNELRRFLAKYKPKTQYTQKTDAIKNNKPVVVNPVKYKPKSGESIVKLPGQKPIIVRRRNEVVTADNRSDYQKRVDQEATVYAKQKHEQQRNYEEAAKGIEAITKLASPSTYVGAVARSLTGDGTFGSNLTSGTGFNDTAANIAFDVASPFLLKVGLGAGTNFLQNSMPGLFDPYTTFRGSLGYYGNSLSDRVLGTLGRRFHLPTKPRMPELFRAEKGGIDVLGMPGYENAAQRGRFPWQNTTTDTIVRDHGKNHWSGSDVVVKNPNMYNPEGYLSTQPSDTFILKGFNNDPFNTSNYTIVSGNTELLKKAKDAGYETLSTPKLRKRFAEMQAAQDAEQEAFEQTSQSNIMKALSFRKAGYSDEDVNYTKVLRKLLQKRGKPTYKDYAYQSEQVGLPITISKNPMSIPDTPLEKAVGNGNIFYNRSTPFEAKLRNSLGIGPRGINIKTRMEQGYTNDFLRKAAEDLNRKLYERR